MLSSIRNKTKGWVAYLIVGLITVPFALFGINEYFTGTANITVASVDDTPISKQEFLSVFELQKRRFQQELEENYTPEFETALKQSVLNQLINRSLLDNLATTLDYTTLPMELSSVIRANKLFQEDGQFSMDKYQQLLSLNGYSMTQYEQLQMRELTQSQIKYNLLDSAFIVPVQLQQLQALNSQQRQFDFISLKASDYAPQVSLDVGSAQEYFDKNKAQFILPEQVQLTFVELSLAEIANNIKPTEAELFSFYEDEKSRFSTEEERKAQHILLADEATAKKVLDLLKKGGDFAKLAQEYSQDSGSKAQAGDLGFFTHGVMVPEFEAKVFAMKVGELSGLVKSEFGYHLIKLTAIKPGTVKPFAAVKAELQDLYVKNQAQKSLYKLADQLANLAYESSLEEVADQLNLPLQTTEFFDKNNTTINAKIVKAAFSDVVFNQNENSEVITLKKDMFQVVRLKQKIAPKQQTFAQVKSNITATLTTALAKEYIDDLAHDLSNLWQKNEFAAQKVMNENRLSWVSVDWAKRNSTAADVDIINTVFILPKPKNEARVYSAQSLDSQRSVLLRLLGVRVAKDTVSDQKLEDVMLDFELNEVFADILKTLRADATIDIFTDKL